MKKLLLSALIAATATLNALAVPANTTPALFHQPNGQTVTLQLHGDEYYDYLTTTDGYTVVKNSLGQYVYAVAQGEGLMASSIMASDIANRQAAERSFLATLPKNLRDNNKVAKAREARRLEQGTTLPSRLFDYPKFHGLIILVEYKDQKFCTNEAQQLWNDIVNKEGFTQYTDSNGNVISGSAFTGSVRDYYRDNSLGKFNPVFDVIGPVEVNYNSTDGRNNARAIFREALKIVASQGTDFTPYDTDGNGYADMVFFVVAGHGSNYGSNNSKLLWPNKSSSLQLTPLNDMRFDLYACSTELRGAENTTVVDGIGTICHEFTHVLGLPDLYDTDYESSGGESHHPGNWDIMAGASYLNSSRTPAGYSAWERRALGFSQPVAIKGPGEFTLDRFNETSEAYYLPSPENRVYYMLENRQQSKWDKYLPGHGLIVTRIDSTDVAAWRNHKVNINPEHQNYEMLRAGNTTEGDLASDPFPGSLGIVSVNPWTSAKMMSLSGIESPSGIYKISEKNGIISFAIAENDKVNALLEDVENIPVTSTASTEGVKGQFTTWTLTKCSVVQPTDSTVCNGKRAFALKNPSQITMTTPLNVDATMVQVEINNPTTTTAKFTLSMSTDNGTTWTKLNNGNNMSTIEVKARDRLQYTWPVPSTNGANIQFRLAMSAGSKNSPCYIDDLRVFYNERQTVLGDVNADGKIDVIDLNILTNIVLGQESADSYNGRADLNGDGKTDIVDVNMVINLILGL